MCKEPRSRLEHDDVSGSIAPIASPDDQEVQSDVALDQLAEIIVDEVIHLSEQGIKPKDLIQYFERQQWQPPVGKTVEDSSGKKGTA